MRVIFLVFTRILIFLLKKKKLWNFSLLGFLKTDVKGLQVGIAEKCKCGRFIHYRILSLFWQMHFPEILSVKKSKLFLCPNYGGTSRGLYINFWCSEIQFSHMSVSINSSALLDSDFKICHLMNNKNNSNLYMLRTINHSYGWIK